jgi:tetratricopeptide (TPR) repeat protein
MAMGVLFFHRSCLWIVLAAPAFGFLGIHTAVADQIRKKDGTLITGQVLSVSDGQALVMFHTSTGSVGKLPYSLSDIDSVDMAPPDAMTKLQNTATPATVVATLEPLIKQFAGLPADWVVQAMTQVADAYSAEGQVDRAIVIYSQIDTFYPGSKYHLQAVAGMASLKLKQGKIDEAISEVQPIIDQANKDIAPSQSEGGLYAGAFLVYGQALEAQKKPEQALEAYLTVKTMFYQNHALADQADQLAKKLRDQNPGLGVE